MVVGGGLERWLALAVERLAAVGIVAELGGVEVGVVVVALGLQRRWRRWWWANLGLACGGGCCAEVPGWLL